MHPDKTSPISLCILKDFKDNVNETPNHLPGQTIREPPPLYTSQIFPAPVHADSSLEDETIYYGVLAVNSNQRHHVGEVDVPILGRQAVENAPQGSVCSNYACQNIRDLPIISDNSLDSHGTIGLAACGAEKNDDEQEEDDQDEETSLISWDPQTGRLWLRERDSALNRGFSIEPQECGANIEESKVLEEGRSAALSSSPLLKSVFVRQSSEEAAKLDTGVATGCKVDNFLSGWDLVFATDE